MNDHHTFKRPALRQRVELQYRSIVINNEKAQETKKEIVKKKATENLTKEVKAPMESRADLKECLNA